MYYTYADGGNVYNPCTGLLQHTLLAIHYVEGIDVTLHASSNSCNYPESVIELDPYN